MTAQNGEGVYGDGAGVVTPLAHKLSQNGPVVKDSTGKPRSGVFYAGNASLVSGKANMSYDVAAFEAAICRGRTKGTSFPTNDGVVNVTTTAAPGSNSRIDIIYLQQQEVSEGDAATQAVVGVVQGTAASSPSAPSLPDGAIELARAVVPAGITATTSATITQTAKFTAAAGGVIPFRSTTDRDAATYTETQLGWLLDTDILQIFDGSAWQTMKTGDTGWTTLTMGSGWTGEASNPPQYRRIGGVLYWRGRAQTSGATTAIATLPAGFRPDVAASGSNPFVLSGSSNATVTINSSGAIALSAGTTGVLYNFGNLPPMPVQ